MTVITEQDEKLGDEICTLAAHMTAATCRWLLLIAEFDEREGWAESGIRSCAHWLSWRCGIAGGTARDQVRVARRLGSLPTLISRFETGELSYAKVRALTRIATPATEAKLVELALEATASQLEDMVREFKRSERVALETAAQRRARRYLRYRYDTDGSMLITARIPPEEGALVIDVLEDLARSEAEEPADREGASAETPDLHADPEFEIEQKN